MKKIITMAVTAALLATMSIGANAATSTLTEGQPTKDIEVKAKYTSEETIVSKYSVDVAWDKMEFTYNVGLSKIWDESTHTYTDNEDSAVWSANGNTVTVTNHSNKDVNVKFSFVNETTDSIGGTFTYSDGKTAGTNGVPLTAGVVNGYASADKVTASLDLNGALSKTTSTDFNKIGHITVALNK